MVSTNDIKINIINLITQINDVDKLKQIYKKITQVNKPTITESKESNNPNFRDAVVEIREGISYQEILEEQNYKPVSYSSFRKKADNIKWEHSLDELLSALD